MSKIPEKVVAEVVKEVSIKMADPSYAQTQVGTWVQTQPHATRYMTSYARELGGAEQVVNMVFHASLLAMCFQRHDGRSVPRMSFADLDAVATDERDALAARWQPALTDYVQANVESPEMRKVLILIILALDRVT